MSVRATALNPKVLAWARARSGLTIQEVAERLKQSPEKLVAWESGEDAPTYNQLEILADSLYKRPVALFFLPSPPDEPPVEREFRTLPTAELGMLHPDTRYALRDTIAFQWSLGDLTGGTNPAERLIHHDLISDPSESPESLAQRVREYLGVSLQEQFSWKGTAEAMASWRAAVESVGIFVRKRSFKQREISGFCVWDDVFPVITINNSTAFARQLFTLFHELAHLLHRVSSITKKGNEFQGDLSHSAREVEQRCNRFASEFLVPSQAFRSPVNGDLHQQVDALARRFHVSREVILRRLLDTGVVDSATYRELAQAWNDDYGRHVDGSGGNYYATQAAYLGRTFLELAFRNYYTGNISLPSLAEHLGIRAKNVPGLEAFLRFGG